MFADVVDVERDATLIADVCIVGGGAAGISIGRALARSGAGSVIILESGGLDVERATQALYRAANLGDPYAPERTRLRVFGGSTGHWQGKCRPLDSEDFETRDWVPFSGWPFSKHELDPYYARAQEVCGLGVYRYDLAYWRQRLPGGHLAVSDPELDTAIFQRSPPTQQFAAAYGDELRSASILTVYLHANVVRLVTSPSGTRVFSVDVATLDGNRVKVSAGVIVLATGGIEAPRLLLASATEGSPGLGNEHDLVGRFFMEHPQGWLATAIAVDDAFDPGFYATSGNTVTAMTDGPDEQQLIGAFVLPPHRRSSVRLLGLSATLSFVERVDAALSPDDVRRVVADVVGRPTGSPLAVIVEAEQVPHPDNRVTLGPGVDALGMPRAKLTWRTRDADRASIVRSLEVMAAEFGRRGLGRMHLRVGDSARPFEVTGIGHHMGTARMHRDARYGVVDEHCRVHGVENLYVAGSAVFPTAGYANPTLTVVALALRLADRLQEVA